MSCCFLYHLSTPIRKPQLVKCQNSRIIFYGFLVWIEFLHGKKHCTDIEQTKKSIDMIDVVLLSQVRQRYLKLWALCYYVVVACNVSERELKQFVKWVNHEALHILFFSYFYCFVSERKK